MAYPNIEVEPSKMSTRGQIVIPQEIREKMGLEKDTLFMVGSLDEETIIMKKVDKSRIVDEFRRLTKETSKIARKRGVTQKDVEKAIQDVRSRR